MRADRIFLKAAEIMDDPDQANSGCCNAIGRASVELYGLRMYGRRTCEAHSRFADLFKRNTASGYWFPGLNPNAQLFLEDAIELETRQQRVYALLIAANVFKEEQV
jgi:hypothetical protein